MKLMFRLLYEYTGCIKMIVAVSVCHYGFENACRSKFPTWNKIAGVPSFVRMHNPASILDLKNEITVAMETITVGMLIRVWQELDYHLDVCRVTNGAHIEHL
jgi:hypothetical protein